MPDSELDPRSRVCSVQCTHVHNMHNMHRHRQISTQAQTDKGRDGRGEKGDVPLPDRAKAPYVGPGSQTANKFVTGNNKTPRPRATPRIPSNFSTPTAALLSQLIHPERM
jgi:hypothetical protein